MDSWLDKRMTMTKIWSRFAFSFKMDEIWSVDSQENLKNCCHQMPDFKAKMHEI